MNRLKHVRDVVLDAFAWCEHLDGEQVGRLGLFHLHRLVRIEHLH
jgi:hypothetical protein